MSHRIPPEAQRLADRLRMLAVEIESAARYGIPIPSSVTVGGGDHLAATFAAIAGEFDAWADYTAATVAEYDYADQHWYRATADLDGLQLTFATSEPIPPANPFEQLTSAMNEVVA